MIFVVSAEDAKELKKKIKNEMNRRKADYGNAYMNKDGNLSGRDFDFNIQPDANQLISQEQGHKIIHPLLKICDKGDLLIVEADDPIPDAFD